MNNWLKQRRKLCDEATDGPWVWDKNREKESANVMYVEPHSDGSGFGQYDLISRDSGVYGPDVKTCEYIMSHDPATMRLIYDVVEQGYEYRRRYLEYGAQASMIGFVKALEALQNKVGGEDEK